MTIKGQIDKIIYNRLDFYILSLSNVKVRVNSPDLYLYEGQWLEVEGDYIEDDKYGRTFIAENTIEIEPIEVKAKVLHVFIKGIGEKLEQQILEHLGENYLDKLEDDPTLIMDMKLNKSNRQIYNIWKDNSLKFAKMSESQICTYLSNCTGLKNSNINGWIDRIKNNLNSDFSTSMKSKKTVLLALSTPTTLKLYEEISKNISAINTIVEEISNMGYSDYAKSRLIADFKLNTLVKIRDNPYLPTEYNVSFEECDKVALGEMRLDEESIHRVTYGLLEVLKMNELEGNTYLNKDKTLEKTSKLLSLEDLSYIESILKMNLGYESSLFVLYDDKLYRTPIYKTERKVANILTKKAYHDKNEISKEALKLINESFLDENQKEIVAEIFKNKVSILTGGPGTGKTTLTKVLTQVLKAEGCSFKLAAPTGRAAKRMSESTDCEALTIHRLLEYQRIGRETFFNRNENNPINADFLIIDESSMIDLYMMNHFLKAVSDETSIVFIGDINQLPSIKAGSLLRDMRDSWIIPVFELKTVYRQAAKSYIIKNANLINENRELEIKEKTDFVFKSISSEIDAYEFIKKCVLAGKDFQVLCPVKNGPFGTNKINEMMQIMKNPKKQGKPEIFFESKIFRPGDKVIQLKNNYDKNVFNGEIGVISKIVNQEVKVYYKDNKFNPYVTYKVKDLKQIDLAYAISIHKSQGSEFDNLIMVIDKANRGFISKELAYTGVTRAKNGLALLSTLKIQDFSNLKMFNNRATSVSEFMKDVVF